MSVIFHANWSLRCLFQFWLALLQQMEEHNGRESYLECRKSIQEPTHHHYYILMTRRYARRDYLHLVPRQLYLDDINKIGVKLCFIGFNSWYFVAQPICVSSTLKQKTFQTMSSTVILFTPSITPEYIVSMCLHSTRNLATSVLCWRIDALSSIRERTPHCWSAQFNLRQWLILLSCLYSY